MLICIHIRARLINYKFKMNKLIVGFVLLGAIALARSELTAEDKAKVKAYGVVCKLQTGAALDLIMKARKGDFTDDAKLKSFAFCMSKKVGFQNEAGDIQNDVVKTKLGKALNAEIADKLIEQCLKKKGTNEETAYEAFKCYYEKTPTHISID